METYAFEGRITALSSISHNGGQSFGIASKLRREKFVQPDGSVEEVPTISGNGLRGMLRDRGMLHFCRSVGINAENGLPLPAFHFLFSGGSLSSTGSKSIDLEQARLLRELIPLVGVFGGAIGNQILPGKLKVGKAVPICAETAHLLPERFRPANPPSVWDYCQEEMLTRKDDSANERYRPLIAGEAVGDAQQMMYYVETFAAGTPFFWRIVLDDPTPLEFEALASTLVEFSRQPYVGGKSNIGMGEVAVRFENWIKIDSNSDAASEVALPLGRAYLGHLRSQRESIMETLGRIQ